VAKNNPIFCAAYVIFKKAAQSKQSAKNRTIWSPWFWQSMNGKKYDSSNADFFWTRINNSLHIILDEGFLGAEFIKRCLLTSLPLCC
jgi:hypothetical protein